MHRDISSHSLLNDRRNTQIQEHKMKAILCILSAACCWLVILTLTTASPIGSTTDMADNFTTPLPLIPVGELGNGSKLVITHVVKTLEFEVDLRDDDDNSTETESSTPYIETGIEVLNPELLLSVVEKQLNLNVSDGSIDGTKNETHEESEEH